MAKPPRPQPYRPLGRRIAELRGAARYSQRALARQIHISEGYMPQIERGESRPEPDVLRRIATVLGTRYDELAQLAGYLPRSAAVSEGRSLYEADPAEAVQELTRLALAGLVRRIPIQETPAHAGEGGIEGQYALLPTEYASENVLAFRITGRCMEPVIEPGDIVIADASEPPEDGAMVVVVLDGETRVKVFNQAAQTLTALDRSPPVAVAPGLSMATLIVINKRAGRVRRR